MKNSFVVLGFSADDIDKMIGFHFIPEVFWAIVVMILFTILMLIVGGIFRKAIKDPLQKPKGIIFIFYSLVNTCENFIVSIMGEKNRKYGGVLFCVFGYVFLVFAFGLTGLSSPMTYLGVPLTLGVSSFLMIHLMAMKENKRGYFKRYIDPFPIFLPINLITMWAPLLSLTLRLFGNALSGYCIMALLYAALEALSSVIFRPLFGIASGGGLTGADILIAPLITPVLHLYFDLFSSAIQALVFSVLTMIFVANEQNDDSEEILDKVQFESN